jgi:hypothetical protein
MAVMHACVPAIPARDDGAASVMEAGATDASAASDAHPVRSCPDAFSWGRGGIDMLPGTDCNGCHRAGGAASERAFSAAGTVFRAAGCLDGLAGVTVQLRDATGVELSLTTSPEGNFASDAALVFPLRARLSYQGRVVEMRGELSSASCGACHSAQRPLGVLLAP